MQSRLVKGEVSSVQSSLRKVPTQYSAVKHRAGAIPGRLSQVSQQSPQQSEETSTGTFDSLDARPERLYGRTQVVPITDSNGSITALEPAHRPDHVP